MHITLTLVEMIAQRRIKIGTHESVGCQETVLVHYLFVITGLKIRCSIS